MYHTPLKQGALSSPLSPCYGNVLSGLISRELYGSRSELKRPFVGDFSAEAGVGSGVLPVVTPETLEPLPPFCVRFCERACGGKLLAVADEEGYITVHDVRRQLPSNAPGDHTPYEPAMQWLAHQNAVFDVCWSQDDTHILSGSGDQTVGVWDFEHRTRVRTLKGHTGSVKSVAAARSTPGVIASGSRDGTVQIWDVSAPGRAAQQLGGAAPSSSGAGGGSGGAAEAGRRRGLSPLEVAPIGSTASPKPAGGKGKASKMTSNSVTGVVFLAGDTLVASTGASDSVVKLWDRRSLDRPLAQLNRGAGAGAGLVRPRGITALALDPSGGSDRIAASYSDSAVCVWRAASAAAADGAPEACLRGHKSGSFYVKIAFSPDGTHLTSGSCDYGLYIWQIARPADPPFVLTGHGREVDGVDWCRTDFGCLASCGDDSTVRVWAVRRPEETVRRGCSRFASVPRGARSAAGLATPPPAATAAGVAAGEGPRPAVSQLRLSEVQRVGAARPPTARSLRLGSEPAGGEAGPAPAGAGAEADAPTGAGGEKGAQRQAAGAQAAAAGVQTTGRGAGAAGTSAGAAGPASATGKRGRDAGAPGGSGGFPRAVSADGSAALLDTRITRYFSPVPQAPPGVTGAASAAQQNPAAAAGGGSGGGGSNAVPARIRIPMSPASKKHCGARRIL